MSTNEINEDCVNNEPEEYVLQENISHNDDSDGDNQELAEKDDKKRKNKWKKLIIHLKNKLNNYESKINIVEEKNRNLYKNIEEITKIHDDEKHNLQDAIQTLKQQVRAIVMLYEEQSNMLKDKENTKKKPVLLPLSLVKKVDSIVSSLSSITEKITAKNDVIDNKIKDNSQNNDSHNNHKSIDAIKKEYIDYLIYIKSKHITRKKKLQTSLRNIDKDIEEINNFIYSISVFEGQNETTLDNSSASHRKKIINDIKDEIKNNISDNITEDKNHSSDMSDMSDHNNYMPDNNKLMLGESEQLNIFTRHKKDKNNNTTSSYNTDMNNSISNIADIQRYLERKNL